MTSVELAKIIQGAQAAAEIHRDSEDGGTCNLDLVCLPVSKEFPIRLVAEAARMAKVHCHGTNVWGRPCMSLGNISGNANRRTRMVNTIAKTLADNKVPAFHHFITD
jgi:hypothetical protein